MTLPEITAEELVEEAWHRYHTEPIFHARVYKAAAALKTEITNTGMPWPRAFDGVLTAAAALGLLMSDIHDPETGDFIDFRRETSSPETAGERVFDAQPTDENSLDERRSTETDPDSSGFGGASL